MAWVFERRRDRNAGRSFGTTLGHFHENFEIEAFRRFLVNGILWTASVDVPPDGAVVNVADADLKLPPEPKAKENTAWIHTTMADQGSRAAATLNVHLGRPTAAIGDVATGRSVGRRQALAGAGQCGLAGGWISLGFAPAAREVRHSRTSDAVKLGLSVSRYGESAGNSAISRAWALARL